MKLAVILYVANTALSLGLNILIKRLGFDPRWRYVVWGVIIANEIRGAYFVYTGGGAAYSWATGGWA